MNFRATLTRYSKTRCERERSGEWLFRAEDFDDAVRTVGFFIQGQKDSDRTHGDDWEYAIERLGCDGYRPDRDYQGYVSIWEDPPTA